MATVRKVVAGKNALWVAYKMVHPDVRDKIISDLKEAGLYMHWYQTASKQGHDLKNAKATLRDIFLKEMPETAPLFGLPVPNKSRSKSAPEDGTLSLFN